MKKLFFPILAILLGIPLLIGAIHVVNYRKTIEEMRTFSNIFVTIDDKTMEEADVILREKFGDYYEGFTPTTNILSTTISIGNKQKESSVFVANESIVNRHNFWKIKRGDDLSFRKIDGRIPVLIGGQELNGISIGSKMSLTVKGEDAAEYSVDAVVVGKIGGLKNIPEKEKNLFEDRQNHHSSFVVMPNIDNFVQYDGNEYFLLWKKDMQPVLPDEVFDVLYGRRIAESTFNNSNLYYEYSLIAIPAVLIGTCLLILCIQSIVFFYKKRNKNRLERSHYEKI